MIAASTRPATTGISPGTSHLNLGRSRRHTTRTTTTTAMADAAAMIGNVAWPRWAEASEARETIPTITATAEMTSSATVSNLRAAVGSTAGCSTSTGGE